MVERSQPLPTLADPPRDIPLGLRLKILAPYDVTGTVLYSIPAAVLLVIAATGKQPTEVRIGVVVLGSILLLLTMKAALPALVRAMGTLHRMRYGFLTVGQVVSCHLVWEKQRSEMAYTEFLENWAVNVGRSQMTKATGCVTTMVVWIFLVPLMLSVVLVLTVAALASLRVPGGNAMGGGLDAAFVVRYALTTVAISIAALVLMRWFRRGHVKEVERYMEWRKLTVPGRHDRYDEHARQLVADAKNRGVQISLKEPLPQDSSSAVHLICKVQYSVMNEPCVARGRARLCRRLDPTGVELLLFDAARRNKVDLLVGLPEEVKVDPLGQWADTRPPWLALLAAVTSMFIALIALGLNIQRLVALAGH